VIPGSLFQPQENKPSDIASYPLHTLGWPWPEIFNPEKVETKFPKVPKSFPKHGVRKFRKTELDLPGRRRSFARGRPAAMVFLDGPLVGAALDRNGLRPARYTITHDGLVVLASEVGVLPIAPERVKKKGRLGPGQIFLVDIEHQKILKNHQVKR
jgi:hypothetical protein